MITGGDTEGGKYGFQLFSAGRIGKEFGVSVQDNSIKKYLLGVDYCSAA